MSFVERYKHTFRGHSIESIATFYSIIPYIQDLFWTYNHSDFIWLPPYLFTESARVLVRSFCVFSLLSLAKTAPAPEYMIMWFSIRMRDNTVR